MPFKPSKEHDYIQANIAYILRNAQNRNRTNAETQFRNNERMKELGLNPDPDCLAVFFERQIAKSVFEREASKQAGSVAKEFKRLADLPYYSFEVGVSQFINDVKGN